jgi:hypothetical protein
MGDPDDSDDDEIILDDADHAVVAHVQSHRARRLSCKALTPGGTRSRPSLVRGSRPDPRRHGGDHLLVVVQNPVAGTWVVHTDNRGVVSA